MVDEVGQATLEREAALRKMDEEDFKRFGRASDGRLASTLTDEELAADQEEAAAPKTRRRRRTSLQSHPEALDEGEGFTVGS